MKHRFQLIILLVSIILTTPAYAYDFMAEGLCYNLNADGTSVTLTYDNLKYHKYPNLSGSITIPATVTHDGRSYLVSSIGLWAFKGCEGLTSVTIPHSVTYIGEEAFYDCRGLTSVTIPNSVTYIDVEAFYNCRGLTSVTIPNSVKIIDKYAFCGCSGLTSISIPNSITSISNCTFLGCSGLMSVTLPNTITSIGGEAFAGCVSLTSVNIPNSVKFIQDWAFNGCISLIHVIIPNSVTYIGDMAFYNCKRLTRIDAYPDPEKVLIGLEVFYNVPKDRTLHVLPRYQSAYKASPEWMDFFNIITDLVDVDGIEVVRVDDIDNSLPMEVYNLNGEKVAQNLNGLPTGIYIVRQGSKCAKVLK